MYTGDVRKRLASYRIPEDLLAAATIKAAECGETVTDAVIRGLEAYVQGSEAAVVASTAPVSAVTVHTEPEVSPWAAEASEELPETSPCPHPAGSVRDTGVCHDCGEDVW